MSKAQSLAKKPKKSGKHAQAGSGERHGKKQAAMASDIVPSPGAAASVHIRMRSEPPGPPSVADEDLVEKWAARGVELLGALAAHDANDHEYRVDLKDGRFVWVDPEGRVSAEAGARAICTYVPATCSLTMSWADPLLRTASVQRIDRIASEHDDLDEEGAWRVAIAAAELSGAQYLYRVAAPNMWYFLALTGLSFQPKRPSFTPSTPAGLVLSELEASRRALLSCAEPAVVVRDRLTRIGSALVKEAKYAYRGTDWAPRLSRTGKRLEKLAGKVSVGSPGAPAKNAAMGEWLAPELAAELDKALGRLDAEWRAFGGG